MEKNNKTQLGKILLKQKLVERNDLDALLSEQRDNPEERLASRAIARGFLDEHRALKALSEQHGVPAINRQLAANCGLHVANKVGELR